MQKLELASCDLVDLLTQAQQRFIPKGEARRVSLQLELGDELPRLQLDRLQIERVIDNLLENALRHSSEGGQIHLQARRQGDRVLIAVEDNGEGIPFSQQGRIFEPFVQVGRKKGGAGLGLALCKEIIQLHGGRIAVRSQPGQGARFYMLLPV